MKTEQELEYRRRMSLFSGPVGNVLRTNALCYYIAQQYANGDIITIEEALSQMVVQLARDWDEQQKRAYELYSLVKSPVVFAPQQGQAE